MRAIMRTTIAIASLMLVAPPAAVEARQVTDAEARTVADNHVRLITERSGTWAGVEDPSVVSMEPFAREGRVLGHYCTVEPNGYLVINLRTEFVPVLSYSDRCRLDPDADVGMTDLLKDVMERAYDAIEDQLGRPMEPYEDLSSLLDRDYRGAWSALADPSFDATAYTGTLPRGRSAGMDYQQGETLLTTSWSQRPPYNDHCPNGDCSWPDYGYYNTNYLTGCVATAGSEIMRYWNWPLSGVGYPYYDGYDWPNMGEKYEWSSPDSCMVVYRDGGWHVAGYWEIYAVAQLQRHVGISVDMDYGCSGSSAYLPDLADAMPEHFRYEDSFDNVPLFSAGGDPYGPYWSAIVAEFNANRPVVYHVPGHAFVADGWDQIWVGDELVDHIHVVYGHGGGDSGWFNPYFVPGGYWADDYFFRRVRPENVIFSSLAANYPRTASGYRYFSRDVLATQSNFEPNQRLQVLRSGFLITNTGSTSSDEIVFNGEPTGPTEIYLYGDLQDESRVHVLDGQLKILAGGQVVMY